MDLEAGRFVPLRHAAKSTSTLCDSENISLKGHDRKMPVIRASRVRASLTLALHAFPLVIYVILIIVWALGLEESISPNPTALNAATHIFIMLLCAIITTTLQPLAIKSHVQRSRTLTALSDYASSWNGFGSSLYVLYQNARLAAAFGPALIIVLYFTCIIGLQTATPLLFSFPAGVQKSLHTMPTRTGFPSFDAIPGVYNFLYNIGFFNPNLTNITLTASFNWLLPSDQLRVLDGNLTFDTPGYTENAVYDTLAYSGPDLNGTATVNRTEFRVSCGQLPDDTRVTASFDTGASLSLVNLLSGDDSFRFNMTDTVLSASNTFSIPGKPLARRQSQSVHMTDMMLHVPQDRFTTNTMGRNLVLYNLYNVSAPGWDTALSPMANPIHDASGSLGPALLLNASTGPEFSGAPVTIFLQPIGCSLSVLKSEAALDVTTNRLVNSTISPVPDSHWDEWVPSDGSDDGFSAGWWSQMFQPQNQMSTTDPARSLCSNIESSTTPCHAPTLIEEYLTSSLYGPPSDDIGLSPSPRDSTNATLANLERTLGRATALMVWSAARTGSVSVNMTATGIDQLGVEQPGLTNELQMSTQTSETVVEQHILTSRLEIDETPLLFGAISSVGLLIVTTTILWPLLRGGEDEARITLDNVSLLTIASLDTSSVAARLSDSEIDSLVLRRRAGLFKVAVVDGRLIPVDDRDEELFMK